MAFAAVVSFENTDGFFRHAPNSPITIAAEFNAKLSQSELSRSSLRLPQPGAWYTWTSNMSTHLSRTLGRGGTRQSSADGVQGGRAFDDAKARPTALYVNIPTPTSVWGLTALIAARTLDAQYLVQFSNMVCRSFARDILYSTPSAASTMCEKPWAKGFTPRLIFSSF